MARSCKVAVIGAGAAGLVAARELGREGHRVTVFEQGDRVGGTWIYTPQVEADPLGQDTEREVVHSSLYKSLRTNLPRKIMGFSDYPFEAGNGGGDGREFPGHEEVLAYLEGFAREFGLVELIRFGRKVVRVEMEEEREGWVVEWRKTAAVAAAEEEVFEAVVVCNGHFTHPYIAPIPGIETWPGRQLHSHNYRIPDPFRGQIVVVIGSGPSALDISRDVAAVAKEVHLASRSPNIRLGKLPTHQNMWQHSMVVHAKEDGSLVFQDGSSLVADTILYCTGYKYSFPFLKTKGYLEVDDNRVHPLYKHVFPPRLAPWLSFIGIPSKVVPFLVKELQAKWLARVLSGKAPLPTEEGMMVSIDEDYYLRIEKAGKPKHHTHLLHPYEFEYKEWLLDQVGLPPLEPWIAETYLTTIKFLLSNDDGFRNVPSKL